MESSLHDLFNINPKCSTTLAFILGLILIDDLNAPEQNMLGNFLILVGQTILTNAASQNIIESRVLNQDRININSRKIKAIYNPIIYDIKKIKKLVNELYPNDKNELNNLYKTINNIQEKLEQLIKD